MVSDRRLTGDDRLVAVLVAAAEGGAACVHLREPDLPAHALFEVATSLRKALPKTTRLLVNDRLDVALAAGADGVHLGERSLPVPAVRPFVPPGFLVGRSIHRAEDAVDAGADFLFVGTVFPSRSHPGAATGGIALVQRTAGQARVPVIAIGGISADNVAKVVRAGASGVAVISAVLAAPDSRIAAAALVQAIVESSQREI